MSRPAAELVEYKTVLDAGKGLLDTFAAPAPPEFVDVRIAPQGVVVTSDTMLLALKMACGADTLRQWDTRYLAVALRWPDPVKGTAFVVRGLRKQEAR